eukprot:CAMPEP_0181229904 /NCGR_PEP_ID=MMETSP1096-20121128/34160_1 /TAXON_ID=156174 ORGANISM="Chrysochromulina ericina, Strain CCMP281" /NCGR_SAMPLE_ID=MMETSP1096 /ASSEMBLY_ACC=CAM_ASM_000453 /LENGTH=104 /DNA_ID=CAMNT_0023323587 /DNA_START=100 /DNA_END=412 /DNA_ORIENTATION=-
MTVLTLDTAGYPEGPNGPATFKALMLALLWYDEPSPSRKRQATTAGARCTQGCSAPGEQRTRGLPRTSLDSARRQASKRVTTIVSQHVCQHGIGVTLGYVCAFN